MNSKRHRTWHDLLSQRDKRVACNWTRWPSEPDYYAVDLRGETGDEELDFRLGVLYNLTSEAEEADWGRQSVVLLNYHTPPSGGNSTFDSDDSSCTRRLTGGTASVDTFLSLNREILT